MPGLKVEDDGAHGRPALEGVIYGGAGAADTVDPSAWVPGSVATISRRQRREECERGREREGEEG